MPAKVVMSLNNGNYSPAQIFALTAQLAPVPPRKPMALNMKSSIVTRIHNVRPGCGSCGK